jgi:nucleotide-binding universal stress UspA family protein
MQGNTLFLVDKDATVSGIAGGLVDLAAIGAYGIEIEHSARPVLGLADRELAKLSVDHNADLIVLGVSDLAAFRGVGVTCRAALPDHPMLYLGVGSAGNAPSLPRPDRILGHVLVPSDYSVRSGCLSACLVQIARRGVRVVTLLHVPDTELSRNSTHGFAGELGRVDIEWVERLKRSLFSAGVEEVRFVSPKVDAELTLDLIEPAVSLVLVGAACNAHVAETYVLSAARLLAHGESVPALMLTAETCTAVRGRGAA